MTVSRLLYGVFAGLSLFVALGSLRILFGPAEVVMPAIAKYLPDLPLAAWAHVLAGPLALALLPFQVNARLRQRAPRLHRRLGYVAVAAMIIGGVSALALLPGFTGSTFAAAGFAALGMLWIAFASVAVLKARNMDFTAHRRYMLRAAVLTFGAVTLRLMMAPLMAQGWTPDETYDITAWGCWLPWLVLLELRLRVRSQSRMA